MILRTSAAWLTASISKTLIAPDVGKSRVLMMRRAVVFPAPLGPMSPYISPCVMLKVSPSSARMLPNCLTRDIASTARVNVFAPLLSGFRKRLFKALLVLGFTLFLVEKGFNTR